MSKSNVFLRSTLFSGNKQANDELDKMKLIAEESTNANCDVLTVGQRCADWFVLRQLG